LGLGDGEGRVKQEGLEAQLEVDGEVLLLCGCNGERDLLVADVAEPARDGKMSSLIHEMWGSGTHGHMESLIIWREIGLRTVAAISVVGVEVRVAV
jgi:hypothetical protein